ncbi:MAG TPA: glycoside hydrolase family 32 protein, partial [Thermotogota bacterium]|nr:glycoside hydrolase family 32 protein [Thermotogota bacterium]
MEKSLRPGYHFSPPTGWLNDPNGLIFYRGQYHLFYQFNPRAPVWGPMHWGHAASDDLFHWKYLPIALNPEKTGHHNDMSGMFSGSAVQVGEKLFLLYTQRFDPVFFPQRFKEQQCVAFSDDGIHFQAHPENPVIPTPPREGFHDFRDPKAWKTPRGTYRCVVGSGENQVGKILLYESEDFGEWKYRGVLFAADPSQFGPVLECPDFFPLGDLWVLFFSAGFLTEGQRKNYYVLGHFEKDAFQPLQVEELDLARDLYASQTFSGTGSRRIAMGWLHNPERPSFTASEGWRGILSLPRELTLHANQLLQHPVSEIRTLMLPWDFSSGKAQEAKGVDISSLENRFALSWEPPAPGFQMLFTGEENRFSVEASDNYLELSEFRDGSLEFHDRFALEEPIRTLELFLDRTVAEFFF